MEAKPMEAKPMEPKPMEPKPMEAKKTETSMICVLGVAGVQGAVELYGVNGSREVTMHGWFAQPTGYSVLSDRPPCLIAVDNDTLSSDMIASLRSRGHSVVVMPSCGLPSQSKYRRTAKDVCQLAMGLAESYSNAMPGINGLQ